jgi:hypothetical protein
MKILWGLKEFESISSSWEVREFEEDFRQVREFEEDSRQLREFEEDNKTNQAYSLLPLANSAIQNPSKLQHSATKTFRATSAVQHFNKRSLIRKQTNYACDLIFFSCPTATQFYFANYPIAAPLHHILFKQNRVPNATISRMFTYFLFIEHRRSFSFA